MLLVAVWLAGRPSGLVAVVAKFRRNDDPAERFVLPRAGRAATQCGDPNQRALDIASIVCVVSVMLGDLIAAESLRVHCEFRRS